MRGAFVGVVPVMALYAILPAVSAGSGRPIHMAPLGCELRNTKVEGRWTGVWIRGENLFDPAVHFSRFEVTVASTPCASGESGEGINVEVVKPAISGPGRWLPVVFKGLPSRHQEGPLAAAQWAATKVGTERRSVPAWGTYIPDNGCSGEFRSKPIQIRARALSRQRGQELWCIELQWGGKTQRIFESKYLEDDDWDLEFVGDLDGDGRPDVLLRTRYHLHETMRLFLSSSAHEGELVREVATHEEVA